MQAKSRLDVLIAERGLCESRERARQMIMAGRVTVNGRRAEKPGQAVAAEDEITLVGKDMPYVSRGGLKLEKALQVFPIAPEGMVALDVGASTGGFTHCLLLGGARKVYAVDVGYGQLDWRLRSDPRVVVMERTNARYLGEAALGERVDIAVSDVSFISLRLILPAIAACLKPGGCAMVLVKPQFEAGREQVGKKGVVRDPAVHLEVLERVWAYAEQAGLFPAGLSFSPVTGPQGNIEFLLYLLDRPTALPEELARSVVEEAHRCLDK